MIKNKQKPQQARNIRKLPCHDKAYSHETPTASTLTQIEQNLFP
jgi:hypothetical protein